MNIHNSYWKRLFEKLQGIYTAIAGGEPVINDNYASVYSSFWKRLFEKLDAIIVAIAEDSAAVNTAVSTESTARKNADAALGLRVDQEIADRNTAIAQAQLASHKWLPAVQTKAALPDPAALSAALNYLCRVINDADTPSNNGVWELTAGAGEWTYFSDNADWIDETELTAAINGHNEDNEAHEVLFAAKRDKVVMPAWTEFTSPAQSGSYTGRMSGPYFTGRYWPNGKRIMRVEAMIDGYKPSTSSAVIHEGVTPYIPSIVQSNIVDIGGSIRVQDTSKQPYHMPLNIGGAGSAMPSNFRVMVSYNAFQLYSVNCGLTADGYQVIMRAEWFEN
jgi:hypothetical protein